MICMLFIYLCCCIQVQFKTEEKGALSHIVADGATAPQKGLNKTDKTTSSTTTVQCFPFYSILLAVNRTRVDFFSLDVEGHELPVLKTIPFHKVDIRVGIQ